MLFCIVVPNARPDHVHSFCLWNPPFDFFAETVPNLGPIHAPVYDIHCRHTHDHQWGFG
ncbi:hypothetical protein BaRGS_00034164, partial [Batillaria attramentaria]